MRIFHRFLLLIVVTGLAPSPAGAQHHALPGETYTSPGGDPAVPDKKRKVMHACMEDMGLVKPKKKNGKKLHHGTLLTDEERRTLYACIHSKGIMPPYLP